MTDLQAGYEVTVITYDIQLVSYNEEIKKADKRYSSGLRGTGQFRIRQVATIDILLSFSDLPYAANTKVGDWWDFGELGRYKLCSVDHKMDWAEFKPIRVHYGFTEKLSLDSKIVIMPIARAYGEGS